MAERQGGVLGRRMVWMLISVVVAAGLVIGGITLATRDSGHAETVPTSQSSPPSTPESSAATSSSTTESSRSTEASSSTSSSSTESSPSDDESDDQTASDEGDEVPISSTTLTEQESVDPTKPLSPPATAADGDPVDMTPQEPVAVDEPADFGNGLVAVVTEVESIEAAALPGETAGPAVAIHLEVRNESAEPVDLSGIAVNAEDRDGVPLVPNFAEPSDSLAGLLEPGQSRTGIYVFRIDGEPDGLSIDVHHDTTASFVVINI